VKPLARLFPVARLRSALRAVGGLAFALLGAATVEAQQPNLLQDGGFELSVVLGPGQFQRASSFGAWTSTPGCSGVPGSALLGMPYAGIPPYEGAKAMHIGDCSGPGSVSQTFSTTVGAQYRVSLAVIGWSGGAGTVRATVSDPSGTQLVGDFGNPGGNFWNSGSSHSFTATGTATTLKVQNLSGASTIDSVSVTLDQQIVTPVGSFYPVGAWANYFANTDTCAQDAAIINLTAIGITPGTTVLIEKVGGMRFGGGSFPNNEGLLTGAFSSTPTLLGKTVPQRIPGVIQAGLPYNSSWIRGYDIPQDFLIASVFFRSGLPSSPTSVVATVPAGAAYLFVSALDDAYCDNINQGLGVRLTVVCTAPVITASPASLEVCFGSSRTLNATATGTAPLSYQWRFQATNAAVAIDIPGATASSLDLNNIDFNYAGSYTCTVTNACGTATTAAATITVHPAGPDITTHPISQSLLCLGATATFTVVAEAHMQGVLQYQWSKDGLPISGATSATLNVTVNSLSGGNYVCRVTEPNCGYSDSNAALLTVNRAPSAHAGSDFNVNEAQTAVSLQGSASDPDGGTLTYAWTQVLDGGTQVTLNGANTLSPTFNAPVVALGGETLTFKLTVTDQCQSSDATVSVSVVNINHPPVAEAGADQSVAEGAPMVTLDGAASFDIDNDAFTRSWTQVSGPIVTLSDPTASQPTFTAPVINGSGAPGVVATLVFKLTVDDTYIPDAPAPGYSLSDVEDLVTIDITNVNNLPVAAAGVDQTVNENAAVTLTGAGSSDPDGDTLTHAWVQVGTPTVTLSDPNTASPTFTAPFVSAGGVDLTFEVTVDDGYGGTATDTIVVHVQNANDPPLASAARPSQALLWPPNHGMVAISILGVTDPNNNATITITGVWQDEATNGLGDGDTPVDAIINPDGTVLVRAERAGNGNGRVYHIHFTAADLEGSSPGVVKVTVPRDKKSVAVDGGALHVSTN
jgi:Immunoglobulin I-set domain